MLTTVEADALCDSSFTSAFAWDRSRKGNLWRRYRGNVLTIFRQGSWFSWCIKPKDGEVRFGNRAFKTEALAMADVYQVLTQHTGEGDE